MLGRLAMLILALTLSLSTIHFPPHSSLRFIEAQVDAPDPAQPEATRARLVQIEKELSVGTGTAWPTGSVVLMAVGFGGAVTFPLVGLLIGVALSGLPGVFILAVGLASGGLTLMLGISGAIWGAAQAGAKRDRTRKLEEEHELLLLRVSSSRPAVSPQLITLAAF